MNTGSRPCLFSNGRTKAVFHFAGNWPVLREDYYHGNYRKDSIQAINKEAGRY